MIKKFMQVKQNAVIPHLIQLQTDSYANFLQADVSPEKREAKGLQAAFLSVFPVEDTHQRYRVEFISYDISEPTYNDIEAMREGHSYSASLHGKFKLFAREVEGGGLKEAIEQNVYLGQLPLMTDRGTFIISGVERVVVNQLRRAPGVYYSEELHASGKRIFMGEIIPYRGPWIRYFTDVNDIMWVALDKGHKVLVTTLLKILGYEKLEDQLKLFRAGRSKEVPFIAPTFTKDKTPDKDSALLKLYLLLRGVKIVDTKLAEKFFNELYFSDTRFNLAKVGRRKLNERFGSNSTPLSLTPDDFINATRGLIAFSEGNEKMDDLDHIGNKQLCRVGELLEDQFKLAFSRLAWVMRERMLLEEKEKVTCTGIMDPTIVERVLQKFFGTSQLSQYVEQTNPLAELTHKRRISRLGPGGLTRETAGLEVRDVHHSHYGRICPIETPEGQNIGIITSLAVFSRVNIDGEIEAPYYKVEKGVVTNKIEYLAADEEDKFNIAHANTLVDKDGKFKDSLVLVRKAGDFPLVPREEIDYIDVSPQEFISVSTCLIPFLEHDDANRALMGSNMQRQAAPLLFPQPPLVGTGMEDNVARDSGCLIRARHDGAVVKVDGEEIVIKPKTSDIVFDHYSLIKYHRTNQDTCLNQCPLVNPGDVVRKGDILADGYATKNGRLALGTNILVAFMPWLGYNFNDAIIVSESLLWDDKFTSVTIQEFQCEVRDTLVGPEEITRDIPSVPEEALAHLDEHGIVRIGAEVDYDDILVGKVSPKGEREFTPEERLLQAIFGEKARDVKDTSLRVPPGSYGYVIDVQILSRKGEDSLYKSELERRTELIKKRTESLTKQVKSLDIDAKTKSSYIRKLKKEEDVELDKLIRGDELAHGVLKTVKVYMAQRRNVMIGDKLSGRHGNKGVVAKIVPREDMPHFEDGTPVEIILNPLSVPSRMNIGQILEANLGLAAKALGYEVITPGFNSATIEEIVAELKKAGFAADGKAVLYDGRTGERFHEKITVGQIYMMKLNHMVEDKIHARSTGSYTLITQQPLGGRAYFGGQRFGEMEVWALEAYGAAYTLQEMLTIKADDVPGRRELYESIIKGRKSPEPRVPASFNVLIKELNSLCLDTLFLKE